MSLGGLKMPFIPNFNVFWKHDDFKTTVQYVTLDSSTVSGLHDTDLVERLTFFYVLNSIYLSPAGWGAYMTPKILTR
jgi:hypothetical protein